MGWKMGGREAEGDRVLRGTKRFCERGRVDGSLEERKNGGTKGGRQGGRRVREGGEVEGRGNGTRAE